MRSRLLVGDIEIIQRPVNPALHVFPSFATGLLQLHQPQAKLGTLEFELINLLIDLRPVSTVLHSHFDL